MLYYVHNWIVIIYTRRLGYISLCYIILISTYRDYPNIISQELHIISTIQSWKKVNPSSRKHCIKQSLIYTSYTESLIKRRVAHDTDSFSTAYFWTTTGLWQGWNHGQSTATAEILRGSRANIYSRRRPNTLLRWQ